MENGATPFARMPAVDGQIRPRARSGRLASALRTPVPDRRRTHAAARRRPYAPRPGERTAAHRPEHETRPGPAGATATSLRCRRQPSRPWPPAPSRQERAGPASPPPGCPLPSPTSRQVPGAPTARGGWRTRPGASVLGDGLRSGPRCGGAPAGGVRLRCPPRRAAFRTGVKPPVPSNRPTAQGDSDTSTVGRGPSRQRPSAVAECPWSACAALQRTEHQEPYGTNPLRCGGSGAGRPRPLPSAPGGCRRVDPMGAVPGPRRSVHRPATGRRTAVPTRGAACCPVPVPGVAADPPAPEAGRASPAPGGPGRRARSGVTARGCLARPSGRLGNAAEPPVTDHPWVPPAPPARTGTPGAPRWT